MSDVGYDDGGEAPEIEREFDAEPHTHDGVEREQGERDGGNGNLKPGLGDPNRNHQYARQRNELREERERRRQLEDRLERLERDRGDKGAPKDPYRAMLDIDAEKDPIGGILAAQELVRTMNAEREQTARQQQASEAENRRVSALATWADAHIEDFKETKPDFDKAVEFMAAKVNEEQREAGASVQAAQQAVARYVLGIIEQAKSSGKDPAAAIYAIATRRGYSVDKGADVAQQNNNGRGESPFARTGVRSGGGGVSMKSAAEAPKVSPRAILKGGDDFDKRFAGLRAQIKGR